MGIIHATNISSKIESEYERYKFVASKENPQQIIKLLSTEGEISNNHVFTNVHSMYDNLYNSTSIDLSNKYLETVLELLQPIDWYYYIFQEFIEHSYTSKKGTKRGYKLKPEQERMGMSYKAYQIIENFYLTCYLVIHHSFFDTKNYKRAHVSSPNMTNVEHQVAYTRSSIPNVSVMLDQSISQNYSKIFNQKMSFGLNRIAKATPIDKTRILNVLKTSKTQTYMVN